MNDNVKPWHVLAERVVAMGEDFIRLRREENAAANERVEKVLAQIAPLVVSIVAQGAKYDQGQAPS
jgi:hypothetical protein